MKKMTPRPSLLQENAECEQGREYMGKAKSTEDCMYKVKEKGAWYFNFGKGGADYGKCYKVSKALHSEQDCSPMFETKQYDFWVIEPGAEAAVILTDTSCSASDSDMGLQPTLERCVESVRTQGGRFLVYGKGQDARRCFKKNTAKRTCPEGLIRNATYDFLEITSFQHLVGLEAQLVKSDSTCRAGDQDMGTHETPMQCMQALVRDSPTVQAKGTAFFLYGKGAKDEECKEEYTSTKDCTEGFEHNAHYDFFKVAFSEGELVKTNARCKSRKQSLGEFETPEECLAKGKDIGARYLSYGKFTLAGECYMDYTASADCPEGGYEPHLYDLYRIINTEAQCKMPSGIQFGAQYTCMEGLMVSHGESCSPQCIQGYAPTSDSMKCVDGSLKPDTFSCIESEAETDEPGQLASLAQTASAAVNDVNKAEAKAQADRQEEDIQFVDFLEGGKRPASTSRGNAEKKRNVGVGGHAKAAPSLLDAATVARQPEHRPSPADSATPQEKKEQPFVWTLEKGLEPMKVAADDMASIAEESDDDLKKDEGSAEESGGSEVVNLEGSVTQGGQPEDLPPGGRVMSSETESGLPPPLLGKEDAVPSEEQRVDDPDNDQEEMKGPDDASKNQTESNRTEQGDVDELKTGRDRMTNALGQPTGQVDLSSDGDVVPDGQDIDMVQKQRMKEARLDAEARKDTSEEDVDDDELNGEDPLAEAKFEKERQPPQSPVLLEETRAPKSLLRTESKKKKARGHQHGHHIGSSAMAVDRDAAQSEHHEGSRQHKKKSNQHHHHQHTKAKNRDGHSVGKVRAEVSESGEIHDDVQQ